MIQIPNPYPIKELTKHLEGSFVTIEGNVFSLPQRTCLLIAHGNLISICSHFKKPCQSIDEVNLERERIERNVLNKVIESQIKCMEKSGKIKMTEKAAMWLSASDDFNNLIKENELDDTVEIDLVCGHYFKKFGDGENNLNQTEYGLCIKIDDAIIGVEGESKAENISLTMGIGMNKKPNVKDTPKLRAFFANAISKIIPLIREHLS